MDGSFGFSGHSPMFGMPSSDMQMNIYYAQQAQAHAARFPHDVHAQRQMQYWLEVVQRQQQGQYLTGPALHTAGATAPMNPGAPAPGMNAGASAPAAAAPHAPAPPLFASQAETTSGSGFH